MMLIFSSTCLTFSEKGGGILGGQGGNCPPPSFLSSGFYVAMAGSGQNWYQIKLFWLCFWVFRGPPANSDILLADSHSKITSDGSCYIYEIN